MLLIIVWIATPLLRRGAAATRHMVLTIALGAALLLPVLGAFVPAWHVSNTPLWSWPDQRIHSPAGLDWPAVLSAIWILGALPFLFRMMGDRISLGRVVRKAVPLGDPSLIAQVKDGARLMGIGRPVTVLGSEDTEVPFTAGWLHPVVVLSPDYPEWSPLRRRAITLHELAHIRRLDAPFQTLCHLVKAVYWFHPMVWLTAREMRWAGERASDDHVLAAGMRPSAYAHELLKIASPLSRPDLSAAPAWARRSELERRVKALLNPAIRRGPAPISAVAVTALTFFIALIVAAVQPADLPNGQSARIIRTAAATGTMAGAASHTGSGYGHGQGYGSGGGSSGASTSSSSSSSVSADRGTRRGPSG